ncbi:MAG TPA: hypothetical protein VFG91_08485 [Woeseiaceae bacterium]|nr:hypothetical protein [Woeseiaceae bacterium]
MHSQIPPSSLRQSRLFRNSLAATILAILGCLSTHILTILGVTATVAWLGTVEHALVVAVVGSAGLTLYAVFRHRRCRPTRAS